MPSKAPTRYVGGYPVYGGVFGDRGAQMGFDQRMANLYASGQPLPNQQLTGMPPPADMGPSEFGTQPTDPSGYPINPNYQPEPTPSLTVTGSGPDSSYNYYDAGNGITYVYDENWNYVRTENNATPQPTKVSNDIPAFGSRVGSYFNPSAGGFMPLGGSAISGSTMLPTTWSNANTGNPSVYAPRALPGSFNGGMISMNPADWGASGGIGPQAVTMAAPGPSAIPKNIVHR